MAGTGWIKLYRKIQDCLIWNDDGDPFDRRSAWIDLLLSANHSDVKMIFDGKSIMIKAGQRITSIRILAERWHWSKDKVKRYLDLLESEGMIVRDSDSRRTLLTIVNYSLYQGCRDTDEDTDKDTNGTPTRTVTGQSQGHSQGHQQVTNNNDNNDLNNDSIMINNANNENTLNDHAKPKPVKHKFGEYQHILLTDSERERLDIDFGVEKALDMIKILDEYIETSGRKYKNHNLVLRGWVLERVNQKKPTTNNKAAEKLNESYARFAAWAEGGSNG